ncbi:MAG: hypothetical protein QRY16_12330 [Enterobacterales bacterium endosymbiont of Blomia tropicalis]|nr:hypothetical protein [Mixta mediterraneensis]MDL4914543.1 hypothetical protein [Mixta mediterraneensis]
MERLEREAKGKMAWRVFNISHNLDPASQKFQLLTGVEDAHREKYDRLK